MKTNIIIFVLIFITLVSVPMFGYFAYQSFNNDFIVMGLICMALMFTVSAFCCVTAGEIEYNINNPK